MTRARRGRDRAADMSDYEWALLNDQPPPPDADFNAFSWRHFLDHETTLHGTPAPRGLWRDFGEGIVEEWARQQPGTRPSLWWRWDAPRLEPGNTRWRVARDRATLCEPRRRLGGIGTPEYEVLGIAAAFSFGIPVGWVNQWMTAYYNGRAFDVHGVRIDTQHMPGSFDGLAPDPANPPLFESQAAYLDRHGLLLPGERDRLPSDAMEPERLSEHLIAKAQDVGR